MTSSESYICLYCCVSWDKDAPIVKTIEKPVKSERTKKSKLVVCRTIASCPMCKKEVLLFNEAYSAFKRMARTQLVEKPILNDEMKLELIYPQAHLKFKTILSNKIYDVHIVIHKGMISNLIFTDHTYLHKIQQLQESKQCVNQNPLQETMEKS